MEKKKKAAVKNDPDTTVDAGTGNVFKDLGFADADERRTKLRLAAAINRIVREKPQMVVAGLLGVGQPKVSALINYKLDGFSVERLMEFLTALDQDVDIVVRAKPASRTARIAVDARNRERRQYPPTRIFSG